MRKAKWEGLSHGWLLQTQVQVTDYKPLNQLDYRDMQRKTMYAQVFWSSSARTWSLTGCRVDKERNFIIYRMLSKENNS